MRAWKFQEDYFYGNKDQVINKVIYHIYPNIFIRQIYKRSMKRELENELKLERIPFLDGKENDMSTKKWENILYENSQRIIRLEEILTSFNSLSKNDLTKIPMEVMDNRKYTADIFDEKEEKIPVKKIVGINRFENYNNWGEIFSDFYVGKTTPALKVEEKLDKLVKLYCKDNNAFVQLLTNPTMDLPIASYDSNLDKYYITSGGSHRAFLAKLLNFDTITVKLSKIITIEEGKKKFELLRKD